MSEHQPFRPGMLVVALAIGILAGFASAILLGLALAGAVEIGRWWPAVVQAHGHAQLFGWVALFVLGVGFHFLPRMRGSPLQRAALVPVIQWLLAGGVFARFVAQIALAHGSRDPWRWLLAASGLAEAAAALCMLVVLTATVRVGPPVRSRAGMYRVLPFLATAFGSFAIGCGVNAVGVVLAGTGASAIIDPRLDAIAVELVLHGLVVCVSIAVAVQTLPLFLRLPAADTRATRIAGALYAISLVARVAGTASGQEGLRSAGVVASAIVVTAFVLRIDVVFRLRTPWTAEREKAYVLGGRKPMRPGMPDRGEFGRFEWLVRGAFAWLLVACVLEPLAKLGFVPPDASRHAFTMGFAALLIGGMAVRMIPGFVGRDLPRPWLVTVLACVGHAAAVCRVGPLLVPVETPMRIALGLSGVMGWGYLLLLTLVLAPLLLSRDASTQA